MTNFLATTTACLYITGLGAELQTNASLVAKKHLQRPGVGARLICRLTLERNLYESRDRPAAAARGTPPLTARPRLRLSETNLSAGWYSRS
jgi:hypothetical protein